MVQPCHNSEKIQCKYIKEQGKSYLFQKQFLEEEGIEEVKPQLPFLTQIFWPLDVPDSR